MSEMTNTQNGNYQYTTSNNAKINNLRESASKYFNNSQETQNLVSVAEKLVNDKGYNITFDNNILDKSGNIADGVIEKVNGEISIRLNPNSERAGEFLLIHEMTHAIETPEIRNFIQNFAQKNPEYSEAIKGLETIYESTEITGETVTDISANLFGNQEFINSLAMDNSAQAKTIIQKIYEAIKSFLNSFTKEGREKNFVSKLEKMWREAYITQSNKIVAPIYSKGRLSTGEDVVVSDDINGTRPTKIEAEQNLKSMLGIRYLNSESGTEISIENKDIKKYLNDGYNNPKNMRLKKRISGNYGEILEIAKIDTSKSKENYKGTNRGKQGFDYYNVALAYPIKNASGEIIDYKYYEARLVVRKDNNNNFAYDLDNFKEKKGAVLDKTSLSIMADKSADGSFNDNNIPQSDTKVNSDTSTKYSMPLNQNNTQELDNSSFSVEKEKYSKYNQTWQEHLDKYYKPTGTRTDMSKIRIPTKQDVNKSANIPTKETINNTKSSLLSTNEQEELNYLKDLPFELTKDETSRMEYLQNKAEGRIKYSELDGKTSYESIKAEYAKYKDISDFDSNLLNKAKSLVEGYRNTDKRTKDQWLFVAKQIGEQFTGNAEALEKYAIQSWLHEKPNNKDNLNRQGAKYVEFQISDWLNSVYEGAGVGTVGKVKEVKAPTKNNNVLIPTKEDVNKTYTKVETTIDTPEKLAEILKEKPKTIEEKDGRLKKLATIKFIDKGYYVDKLARSAKNKELSSKYDYSLLANGIANNIIGNGRVDEKGNKIGKGLYEIFEPIENSGLIDDFSKYIYHKHNVDRMNLTTRYAEENKAIFGDSMTSEVSEGIVKEYETKYPEFEAWAEDIYKYNQANLEMLVKYGVISKESLEYYNKKYPHYVPTIRDNSKVKAQMEIFLGKKAKVNNPIKKAKGGNSDIIPLKDAMALRTMQTVNSALRNNFGLELMNTIEVEATKLKQDVDSTIEEINFEDLLTEKSKENPATLTVFQDGEKIKMIVGN